MKPPFLCQQCCCGGTATGPGRAGGYPRCRGPRVAASSVLSSILAKLWWSERALSLQFALCLNTFAHTMPRENLPFLLLPCQESHSRVLSTPFGFVWIPQAEFRGASSFRRGLLEASYPCLPASCANPSLSRFVVVKVLSLGKIVLLSPGTSAERSAGRR